jgi:hypothetical protein
VKTVRETEVIVCDVCGEEVVIGYRCEVCGKDFCYNRCKDLIIVYPHSTYASGYGDGIFCRDCEAELLKNPTPRFKALQHITRLRYESALWHDQYKQKEDLANAAVKRTLP